MQQDSRRRAIYRILFNLPKITILDLFRYFNSDDSQITGAEYGNVNSDMLKNTSIIFIRRFIYLSGPEGMVKAMRQMLVELEVNKTT